jgi:hypothetical protein
LSNLTYLIGLRLPAAACLQIQDFHDSFPSEDAVASAVLSFDEVHASQKIAELFETDIGVRRASQNSLQHLLVTSHENNLTRLSGPFSFAFVGGARSWTLAQMQRLARAAVLTL